MRDGGRPVGDITIERATTSDDIEAVRDLIGEYLQWSRTEIAANANVRPPAVLAEEVAVLPGRFDAPLGCLLLARLDGVPAGCVGYSAQSDATMELSHMFVRPSVQGNGIGRRMLSMLLGQACAAGYQRFVLSTHRSHRCAQHLFRRAGFQKVDGNGHHAATVAEGEIRMEMNPAVQHAELF